MSDAKLTKEALIIRLAAAGMSYSAICTQLGVGRHRVSHALKYYRMKGIIPEPRFLGRCKKITKASLDFIEYARSSTPIYQSHNWQPISSPDFACSYIRASSLCRNI
jgi:transposase